MKKKFPWKNSIRVQLAGIFIVMLLAVIGASILINVLFLQKSYIANKQREIQSTYNIINMELKSMEADSESFSLNFSRLAIDKDLAVVIADSGMKILYSTEKETNMMASRLLWRVVSGDTDFEPGNAEVHNDMPLGTPYGGGEKSPSYNGIKGDRDFEKMKEKLLASTDRYTISTSSDPAMRSDFIELWGYLDNGNLIFIRSPLESIRESAAISNSFMLKIGLIIALIAAAVVWFVSKTITDPLLELTRISDRMAHMDFDARYESGGMNEIAELGEHMNEMSMQLEKSVSELKSANYELQRDIEKKEKVEAMRSEFISNVSHELKTPIALISGYAEGLRDGIAEDEESRNEYLGIIIDESQRMGKLVGNLLELNHIESGADPIKVTRFDLTSLIENTIASSDILIKQNGIEAELKDKEPCLVWSDESMTETVFSNYLSNAIRYCGGEKRIEVSVREEGDLIRVEVFNTGDPIPEDSIDRIWDKFYKVDKARTREAGGSGVGLSIVKALMDTLNKPYGVINYDNGVGFWFELDAAR